MTSNTIEKLLNYTMFTPHSKAQLVLTPVSSSVAIILPHNNLAFPPLGDPKFEKVCKMLTVGAVEEQSQVLALASLKNLLIIMSAVSLKIVITLKDFSLINTRESKN